MEGSAITVKIGAETDGIQQGLKNIQNSLKNLEGNTKSTSSEFDASFTKIAGAVAVGEIAVKAFSAVVDSAFNAAREVVAGFGDALDLGGRLSDLSASTGETAGNLLVLERAFDTSGIGADKVGSAIAKMQKNIEDARDGSGTAANAFASMGVSVDELEGKLPTEQLQVLASGIQSIDDPTQRAAAAMGVFGKSGAELIPLLSNLEGELSEARDTVGSMAELMDRRNATFDAVSDRFKIISEKVRDFAAGILDRAIPAIDAITTALSRIDAAKIGQNLADAFLGGEKAMAGFQAAVDAFKTGQISSAFQIFWDSTKLQAAETANEIYKRLIAAFQSAGELLGEIFSPSGALIETVVLSFELLGQKAKTAILENLAGAFDGNMLTQGIADNLKAMAGESQTAATSIEESLKGAGGRIAEQFINAGKALPQSFEENYAKVPPLFNDLEGLQASIAAQEQEIAANVTTTNAEREKTNEKLESEKAARAKIAADAKAAAEEEKANAVALVELETQINVAKAEGNEELAKILEGEKQRIENEQEIAKLTEEYKTKLGVNANEAARLANNFVAAKNAAAGIGNKEAVVTVTTKVDDTRWKDLLAELAVNSDPKAIAVALEVTGKDNLTDALSTLQNMETINKNYQAAFTAIGASSIEEVLANLKGIPTESQRQLAMKITGEEDFDRAVRKLDSFAGTKETKLLLQSQGFESMDSFQNQLDGIVGDKRTDLILESFGVEDVKSAKEALEAILANNGKKATITAEADTTPAEQEIDELSDKTATVTTEADTTPAEQKIDELSNKTATVPLDGDTTNLDQSVSAFTSKTFTLNFNADTTAAEEKLRELETPIVLQFDTSQLDQAIAEMQLEIANSFVGGTGGGGGAGGQGGQGGQGGDATIGTLSTIVEDIKGLLTQLNSRLPSPVLT
jgi:hypothetical protein